MSAPSTTSRKRSAEDDAPQQSKRAKFAHVHNTALVDPQLDGTVDSDSDHDSLFDDDGIVDGIPSCSAQDDKPAGGDGWDNIDNEELENIVNGILFPESKQPAPPATTPANTQPFIPAVKPVQAIRITPTPAQTVNRTQKNEPKKANDDISTAIDTLNSRLDAYKHNNDRKIARLFRNEKQAGAPQTIITLIQFCKKGMQKRINWRSHEVHVRLLERLDLSQPELTLETIVALTNALPTIPTKQSITAGPAVAADQHPQAPTQRPLHHPLPQFAPYYGRQIPLPPNTDTRIPALQAAPPRDLEFLNSLLDRTSTAAPDKGPLLRDFVPPQCDDYTAAARLIRFAQSQSQVALNWRLCDYHARAIRDRTNAYGTELIKGMPLYEGAEKRNRVIGFARREDQKGFPWVGADWGQIEWVLQAEDLVAGGSAQMPIEL